MYGIMFCLEFYALKREYCYEYKRNVKKTHCNRVL